MSKRTSKQLLQKAPITEKELTITQIPMKIFYPHRILMLQMLSLRKEVRFSDFIHELKVSRGQLWSHIRALVAEGLMKIYKELHGTKVKTAYCITKKGTRIFEKFGFCMLVILLNCFATPPTFRSLLNQYLTEAS